MRGLNKSTLFHKKSKSSLQGRKDSLEEHSSSHTRKWSTSSTVSTASSSSDAKLYDPLSLHPPLCLNTSPNIIPEYEEERHLEKEERERRFLERTPQHPTEHLDNAAEYSPLKDRNCFFAQAAAGRPYVYDQTVQWPLKDWQAIPPGLAELNSSSLDSSPASSPTQHYNHRRRPTEWMSERDALLKRGDWKRRGIVFHLDPNDEEEQEQHFELPEC
ncbi:hypothetical protein F4813DRAFT_13347 [Daldinia decipiens]|uniref:uncharacterized protein n=1 Tax=Daldinia decipiens TaxID=326647 RepID=UPI0020C31BA7|nr:uncharacterized protein F4813DRAFT_13347 [Daldinia decipiens]KAI1662883.1 hypothetical protein F4813DRAFT_13347 [Daldinia decipiens]